MGNPLGTAGVQRHVTNPPRAYAQIEAHKDEADTSLCPQQTN